MNLFDRAKSVYGVAGLAAILLGACWIVYLYLSTQPVLNFDISTNVTLYPGAPANVLFPTNYVKNFDLFILLACFGFALYRPLIWRGPNELYIKAEEAEKAVVLECNRKRLVGEPLYQFMSLETPFNALPFLYMVDGSVPKYWVVYARMVLRETKEEVWLRCVVDAKRALVTRMQRIFESPGDYDSCSRCGKDFDERQVLSPEFRDRLESDRASLNRKGGVK